jgi:hypothetical protein
MPVLLATLDATKTALRVLHDDDDAELLRLIEAASAAVIDYLGETRATELFEYDPIRQELLSGGLVPSQVERATIIVVQELYEAADEHGEKRRPGGLPYRAEMLLYRLTDPPLA